MGRSNATRQLKVDLSGMDRQETVERVLREAFWKAPRESRAPAEVIDLAARRER